MTRTALLHGLPLIESGPNRGRLDRPAAAKQRHLTLRQLSKAYNLWIQLFRGKGSTLLFTEYLDKLVEAKITPDDIGNHPDQYHLARYNDVGPYTRTSCRFIPARDNRKEEKCISPYYHLIKKVGDEKASQLQRRAGRLGGLAPRRTDR